MKLFKNLLLFGIALILFSCAEQKEKPFSIQGTINPIKSEYILLSQVIDIEKKSSKLIDTIYLKGGKFKASYNLEPHLYFLEVDGKKINLAIGKNQEVIIEINNVTTKITGSKDTAHLLAYQSFRAESLDRLVKSVRRKVSKIKESSNPNKDKIRLLELEEIENYKIHLDELNEFISKNMSSSIAIYATSIRWKGAKNIPLFKDILSKFENNHPNLKITQKLKDKVTRIEKTAIGSIFEDVKIKSNTDTIINLYNIHKKYTLIDFWASWCGPCRTENYMLTKMYRKYNSKGFEIYNISLDQNKSKWHKAIEEDKRIWPNVSSLKGFKSKVAYNYNVTSLPTNYLIDENYKIIRKNLHGKDFENVIDSLFRKMRGIKPRSR